MLGERGSSLGERGRFLGSDRGDEQQLEKENKSCPDFDERELDGKGSTRATQLTKEERRRSKD